jgi:hypothetical protein
MRTIQTFVLRLLTSSDEPQVLRGLLQVVANGEEQPFNSGAALLALLRQMAGNPPAQPRPESEANHGKEPGEA